MAIEGWAPGGRFVRRTSGAARPRTMTKRVLARARRRDLAAGELPPPTRADDAAAGLPGRPATWGECRARGLGTPDAPCAYVSCGYHLYLDVTPRGALQLNFPEHEPHELRATCALAVAEAGGLALAAVGRLVNLTRERVRQLERAGLARLAPGLDAEDAR